MKLIQQPTPEDTAFELLARRIELRGRKKSSAVKNYDGWDGNDSPAMSMSESAEAAALKEEIVAKIEFGLKCVFGFLIVLAIVTIVPILVFGGQ